MNERPSKVDRAVKAYSSVFSHALPSTILRKF